MSKSDPNSGIFIHDTDEQIKSKLKKAWCEEGNSENNPLLEISKQILFHEFNEINIERPEKFGGNVTYSQFSQLENDFSQKKLHPSDLKNCVSDYLIKIIKPIRDNISLDEETIKVIKNSV